MKIFVVMHTFNNFGGIINHNEELCAGFKDLGHEVTFAYIKPTKNLYKESAEKLPEGFEIGVGTGYPVHQGKGWLAPYYSLKNQESIRKFVEDANNHDIVIWQSIFGFKNSETEEYTDWIPMIEEVNSKQVVIIHDGNLKKLYSWIYKFQHKFSGIACVHPSAFKSADFLTTPRNLILNPQNISQIKRPNFENKKRKLLSLQTFKRWKRVDDLISAIPYINGKVLVAGDGIERNYMTSIDKCKPEYYCTPEKDPSAKPEMINNRIWDNAKTFGDFDYIGFITGKERDSILETSMFLLDPSWSMNYGEHFNRVIVDSMVTGTVPIARNFGVSDNEKGIGEIFKPNENYLMIPHDAKPKEFGDLINSFFSLSKEKYEEIVDNNIEKLNLFDRKNIAQQYIDLAMGKDAGVYEKNSIGVENQKVKSVANSLWEFFEPPVVNSLEDFF